MENSKKFLQVAGGIFLIAAALLSLKLMFQSDWFKNIRAEVTNPPYARTISVQGEGKINAIPDIAMFNLSVASTGKTVGAVTKDGNEKMGKVIDVLKDLGVDKEDIVTSQYNLVPQYGREEEIVIRDVVDARLVKRPPKIVGYKLTQQVSVKVRELAIVDDVLDAGIKAGANQVGQLYFDIDDDSEYMKEARKKAFDAAREKADEMVDAAGVGLGRVVTFYESDWPQPYPMYRTMDMAVGVAEVAEAPAIEPGSKELTITVNVTYEID